MSSSQCSRCGQIKPIEAFSIRRSSGKPRSDCKACAAAKARVYRADNLELVRARNAAWMRDHYRVGHADEIRERQRQRYAEKGAQEQREARRRKRSEDFFGWHVQFARRFNPALTVADLRDMWDAQQGRCGLTGRVMEPVAGKSHIDHIIPQARGGGHGLENLRWVCAEANLAKRGLLDEEFLALCEDVAEWIGRRLREAL